MTFNLAEHPGLAALAALTLVLAGIGTWYVIRHHFRLILLTILCGFGFFAGGLVIWRGANDSVLVGVGLFLLVIFPAIWLRAIGSQSKPPPKPQPSTQAFAAYDLEIKPKGPPPTGAASGKQG